jgi:hypothetical protein
MNVCRQFFFLTCVCLAGIVFRGNAQSIGGTSVFNFLKLPAVATQYALGGQNTSSINPHVGLAFANPAQLKPSMHAQTSFNFNAFYAGIKNYGAIGALRADKIETMFAAGVNYIDYGNIQQTDAAGSVLGVFRPTDYVVQVSASRQYLEKFTYGITAKYVDSRYAIYHSNGIALDAGVAYYDSAKQVQVSLLLQNMGTQLQAYQGTQSDVLPLDVQVGVTKRLSKAPVQFSVTAHHLHQFNLLFDDTSFNRANDLPDNVHRAFSLDNISRHFVFASEIFLGDKVTVTVAYNFLRRKELAVVTGANGITGLSFGVGVLLGKFDLRFARGYYQRATGDTHVGLNLRLDKIGRKIVR